MSDVVLKLININLKQAKLLLVKCTSSFIRKKNVMDHLPVESDHHSILGMMSLTVPTPKPEITQLRVPVYLKYINMM